jgi:hypothetical protein
LFHLHTNNMISIKPPFCPRKLFNLTTCLPNRLRPYVPHSHRYLSTKKPFSHAMSTAPSLLKSQDPTTVNALVALLDSGVGKKPKTEFSCRKNTFDVDGTEHKVNSWKFLEQDFKKHNLPTYARGLFTWRDPVTGNHRIAVRGYDKFFNIGEVKRTIRSPRMKSP